MSHFITRCLEHDRIISECRCPDQDKPVSKVPCPVVGSPGHPRPGVVEIPVDGPSPVLKSGDTVTFTTTFKTQDVDPVDLDEGQMLTRAEHKALDLTAQLSSLVCREVIGKNPTTRDQDIAEFASAVHVIQKMIMAQAAARAYPSLYRLLGDVVHDEEFDREVDEYDPA